MPQRLVIAALLSVVALSACNTSPSVPTATASARPAPTASPAATASPEPSATPAPSSTPAPSPAGSPALTPTERFLLAGVRRGAIDCGPVKDPLPDRALAGIECASDDARVARIGFYLFANDADMLDVYMARMTVEGVQIDSSRGCVDGEGEGAYTPWADNETAPFRQGCFINDEGYANYRATLPGPHLYIGILGRDANTQALEDFAWKGNQDVPGSPTLWAQPSS